MGIYSGSACVYGELQIIVTSRSLAVARQPHEVSFRAPGFGARNLLFCLPRRKAGPSLRSG